MAAKKKNAPARAQKPARDFQTIVADLQKFWVDWGCVAWQPHNSQVGAGTMNPATFLRVLGPEPWNVAYLEPSVRPDDGRYGENPNRLQQHYQFQVILKPDPGDPQEVYLRSLQAIGVDVHKHDIRFVEDNWASPALGAWGLGWEVWLDGLEITQFTYFQQAGGITLDPVSVEITYGLDRIAMALQGVQTVSDVKWSKQRSWGDLNLQGEREHSKYYFEVASVESLRQMYDLYEQEAKVALEAGLMLPAYDYVLKSSHTFNVLDARGAIGVTERQGYFRRMRALSSQVANAYVTERQRLEYPWLDDKPVEKKVAKKAAKLAGPKEAADFLLEIGTEELPPSEIKTATQYFERTFRTQVFDVRNSTYKNYSVYSTPRRLIVYVEGLEHEKVVHFPIIKGPPSDIAFDSLGTPTKALIGWAKQNAVELDKVEIDDLDGGRYVVKRRKPELVRTIDMLAHVLPAYAWDIKFEKTMRWNDSKVTFSRPIRWLMAMFGESVIPLNYAGLQSSKSSRGLRLSKSEQFTFQTPKNYFTKVKGMGILVNPNDRRKKILSKMDELVNKFNGSVAVDEDLLDEVVNLVEAPKPFVGEFDKGFLELPREVLTAVMKKHQRYFPVEKGGKLVNAFIAVGNGEFDAKAVTAGNADVLRARFTDAAYFIKKDREHPLEYYVEKLKGLVFQKELGSMWDKTQRVVELTKQLSEKLDLSDSEKQTADRAAQLSKADLATKMVVEMTSLQGVMGKYYALDSGEKSEIAEAILEHYLPRYSADATAKSKAGLAVSNADRLDSLTGLFGVGLAPTGTKDPFAQRRAAIGLVQNLIAWKLDFDLREGIALAAAQQPVSVDAKAQAATLDFITGRLRALLLEQAERHDVVDAVLAAQGHNPPAAVKGIKELAGEVTKSDWVQTLDAFARCVRITRDLKETYTVDENKLADGAEKTLFAAVKQAETKKRRSGSVDDFLTAFVPMIPAINTFFEKVMVMTEDEALRRNRLALLQRVAALADGVADFSKLEGF